MELVESARGRIYRVRIHFRKILEIHLIQRKVGRNKENTRDIGEYRLTVEDNKDITNFILYRIKPQQRTGCLLSLYPLKNKKKYPLFSITNNITIKYKRNNQKKFAFNKKNVPMQKKRKHNEEVYFDFCHDACCCLFLGQ